MNDVAAAIARHKEVLAAGDHLFSSLQMTDVYDSRGGPLAAACQLAFTIVTPRAH